MTWEPNLSGIPDPSGLQLRIDGALTSLGPQGVLLGAGGRVAPQAGGALEADFPDGKTLLVTAGVVAISERVVSKCRSLASLGW